MGDLPAHGYQERGSYDKSRSEVSEDSGDRPISLPTLILEVEQQWKKQSERQISNETMSNSWTFSASFSAKPKENPPGE
jgi:hypothetical protein